MSLEFEIETVDSSAGAGGFGEQGDVEAAIAASKKRTFLIEEPYTILISGIDVSGPDHNNESK